MPEPNKIAVAGATGRVGHHAADVLAERGYQVVPISRGQGVDVITGSGLEAALEGVDVVIDAATGPSAERDPATEFFTTAVGNLHEAGQRAGVGQMIVMSIIGTDRTKGGYGLAQQAHEQAALAGPIPARILRAAQFHEFVAQLTDWGTRGDVAYVPRMRTQLVAALKVAETLADMVALPGMGRDRYLEVAGPRVEYLPDMAALLAERRGHPAKVEGVRDDSDPDADLYESGGLLPGPGAILGGPTFAEWLAATA